MRVRASLGGGSKAYYGTSADIDSNGRFNCGFKANKIILSYDRTGATNVCVYDGDTSTTTFDKMVNGTKYSNVQIGGSGESGLYAVTGTYFGLNPSFLSGDYNIYAIAIG